MIGHMKGRRTDPAALLDLLLERGMTLIDLARTAGVSYSLIRYVMAGERQFSDLTAHKVAQALGCPVEAFSHHPSIKDGHVA